MSDIKAGDLVMVVKPSPCCGNTSAVGKVFVVAQVVRLMAIPCHHCRVIFAGDVPVARSGEMAGTSPWQVLAARLIRIDPPALPESVATDEEITA